MRACLGRHVLALLVAACSTIGAVSAWLNDEVAFTPSQLQHSLDKRFPRTFDKLGGLVAVTLANPGYRSRRATHA